MTDPTPENISNQEMKNQNDSQLKNNEVNAPISES